MKSIRELYEYRQMILSLVRKELRGRYKGSVLGFAWTFINPLLQLFVYTFVFSVIMRANIEKYYIFLFVALVPWIFFSSSINGGCTSVLSSGDMVKKIYFPREVLPIAYVTSNFVNMVLSFLVVFAVLLITGYGVNMYALLYLPIIMVVEYIFTVGIVLLTAALTVYFRDLAYILSIVTMVWQYLSPVMYSVEMMPDELIGIWNLNPMTSIITAYREILYYKQVPQLMTLVSATIFGFVGVLVGYIAFRYMQRGFAEEL